MTSPGLDLYWLPLGAGGHVVRLNGWIYERVTAAVERRRPTRIYHSALQVTVPPDTYVIEMIPAWHRPAGQRQVVAVGPVGLRWAGRSALFRYEVHCWKDGSIPDVAEAVGGARRLSSDTRRCADVLDVVTGIPVHIWGRDELGVGEMWNSNSVVAWILERVGIDAGVIMAPAGGRAPGWRAGVVAAGGHPASG